MNNDDELYVFGDVKTDMEGRKWLCLGKNKWALIYEPEEENNNELH